MVLYKSDEVGKKPVSMPSWSPRRVKAGWAFKTNRAAVYSHTQLIC